MGIIDAAWIAAHPLPAISPDNDKNSRGRVLVVGGAEFVPGALRLTGEAALRAGAGKLQMATVKAAAMSLAVLMPEAAMIALPADNEGEIAGGAAERLADHLARCDVLILGPGMSAGAHTADLVEAILGQAADHATVILDAAALTCAGALRDVIAARKERVIITPHHREMSYLTGSDAEAIGADPARAASEVANAYDAVVLLKGAKTVLAAPDAEPLWYEGGSIGLATGGSGDVLAGIIGGLAARGATPVQASGWGAFIHGEAGACLSRQIGAIGFLSRELLPLVPALIETGGESGRGREVT